MNQHCIQARWGGDLWKKKKRAGTYSMRMQQNKVLIFY